ncbi:MAG: hypothetical protein IPK82_30120 [Polyangiaceae bacterium]|nr:hypothetical protein [Polyangiaceae bacterium]
MNRERWLVAHVDNAGNSKKGDDVSQGRWRGDAILPDREDLAAGRIRGNWRARVLSSIGLFGLRGAFRGFTGEWVVGRYMFN